MAPKSSKVANERSKMHENPPRGEPQRCDPRRRQTRRGAPRRGILLRHLHRAASDIVTTSDVTPSHRERLSTPTDVTAQQALINSLRGPSQRIRRNH